MLFAVLVAGVVGLASDDDGPDPGAGRSPATTAEPSAPPAPRAEDAPGGGPEGLAIGMSDRNANLLWADDRGGPFEPWRRRVEALRPRYYRLMVDWWGLQREEGREPNLDEREDGCLREEPPCREFSGTRDVLRAVAAQQREHGGWEVVVTLYGVPDWAASKPRGCERSTETARSRPMTERARPAWLALVRRLVRLADEEGVELKWWSPWNEANQPFFVSPQRLRCDARAPSLAPRVYTRLVRALRGELRRIGGDRRLVLGELAAASKPSIFVTGIAEFVRALPDDVACAGEVWSQHEYAERGAGSFDAVGALRRALDARPCTRGKRIWVTETGVGGAHVGDERSRSPRELAADCRAMERSLRRWRRDPRVDAAFQYSVREDPAFPVGLFDQGLTQKYAVYDLWRSASAGRISCPA